MEWRTLLNATFQVHQEVPVRPVLLRWHWAEHGAKSHPTALPMKATVHSHYLAAPSWLVSSTHPKKGREGEKSPPEMQFTKF